MKTERSGLLSAVVLAMAGISQPVVAQTAVRIPMDAAGRPLLDDRAQRLEYPNAPAQISPWLAGPTASKPALPKALNSTLNKSRVPRLQSTGVSPSYYETWRTAALGAGIGGTGFWPVDVDSDGREELVVGGGSGFGANSHWSIVGLNENTHGYDILWQSPIINSITALRVVELPTNRHVWVGRSDGRIQVVDALTRTTVTTLAPSNSAINDFAIDDADNDGVKDVVVATATQLFLYDPETLTLTRTIPYGGQRVATGNVDADDHLEVVLNGGQVLDIDGGATTVQWSTTAFGARIDLADIDGDGAEELIAAEAWYTIRAWDLDAQSLKWSINADLDITAMRLIDVAGDSVPELVYGDGQWGEVHVIDAVTRTELWSIPNPDHSVTDIAVVDSDGDGALEIIWGAGWTSTGPDYMYVHDLGSQAFEWRSTDFSGPFQAVDVGDVDADGRPEIVVASFESESGYADGLLMVFDAATHVLEWRSQSNVFDRTAWTGVHDLKLANIDRDAQLEIIVGTDRLYDGALFVIDGLTHERQNQFIYDSGSPLQVLDLADLTGDGRPEVFAGNSVAHTGSPGVFLYVLDPSTGEIVWQSASIASGFATVNDVQVTDVGGAGVDLLAASSNIHVVRWSDRRHLVSGTSGYVSVGAADLAGTAEREILGGRTTGSVDVLDAETLTVLATYGNVCTGPVTALQMHTPTRIMAACDSTLVVYDVNTRAVIDLTPSGASSLGMNASLVSRVVDNRSVVLTGGSEAVKFVDLSGNRLPVVSPLTGSVHWRSTADLQINASDADGDPIQFELVSLPTLGTATWLNRNLGSIRYTAGGVRTGRDAMLVRASDGAQYSAPQPLVITLTNTSPQVQTTALSFHWRGEQSANLLATDADGDPLRINIAAIPQRGRVVVTDAGAGAITYIPTGAFVGSDTLTYTATDEAAVSSETTVQITLTNTSPTAAAGEFDVVSGSTIHSRFGAQDANSDPLTYSVTQQPSQGTLTFEPATGLFQYTPRAGGSGSDTATFSVSDGVSQSQATVQFRYPPPSAASSGGGGGGGGSFNGLLLAALAMLAAWSRATSQRRRSYSGAKPRMMLSNRL